MIKKKKETLQAGRYFYKNIIYHRFGRVSTAFNFNLASN